MSRFTVLFGLVLLSLFSGCGRLVYKPKNQPIAGSQQQMQLVAQQSQEFQTRAQSLDKDNQELESLLAQSRQKVQLLTDEISATRGQLKDTTDQLLAIRDTNNDLRSKTTSLLASAQQRAGAQIRSNNSMLKNLTIENVPGAKVRQDGDVVRVEIAGDQIFMPGSAYLKPGGEQLIRSVANELRRNFPDQIIGIEGHTDNGPTHSQQFPSNHHLSSAQAVAAYNLLVQQRIIPTEQLFVVGHGANHPLVSNATDSGKTRNRRIELVVYPERAVSR